MSGRDWIQRILETFFQVAPAEKAEAFTVGGSVKRASAITDDVQEPEFSSLSAKKDFHFFISLFFSQKKAFYKTNVSKY